MACEYFGRLVGLAVIAATMVACSGSGSDYLIKGNSQYSSESFAEAELSYRKAIQLDPDLAEAHYQLGLTHIALDKRRDARDDFRRALSLDASLVAARQSLADLLLADYIRGEDRSSSAREDVMKLSEAILSQDPGSVLGLRAMGWLALVDKRASEAVEWFEKAHGAEPLDPETAHGLVQALAMAGREKEAEELAESLIARDGTYGALYDDLYALYEGTDRESEAEKVFRLKVENNPDVPAYRLQLAAHYYNSGMLDAMEHTLQALENDPARFPSGSLDSGEFYLRIGEIEAALERFRAADAVGGSVRLAARKRLIQALAAQERLDEATQIAQKTCVEYPEDSEIAFVRAGLWLDADQPSLTASALEELRRISADYQADPRYWLMVGQGRRRQGRRAEALAAYRQSSGLDPSFRPALLGLAELYLEAGQAQQALDAATKAGGGSETDLQAGVLHSQALLQLGRAAEARNELAVLSKRFPGNPEVEVEFGRALLMAGEVREAEAVFQRLCQGDDPDPRALSGLARTYLQTGRGREAIDLLSSRVETTTNPKAVRELLGSVALSLQRPQLAVQQFAQLVELDPNASRSRYLLAEAQRAAGDRSAAIESLERAQQMDPDDPVSLSLLAFLLQEAGRSREAIPRFQRLLELRPNDSNVSNNLAFLLAEGGVELDEALRLAQTAVREAPESSAYSDTLGWVYLKMGNAESASQIFSSLVRKEPSIPTYRYHLGLAHIANGRSTDAREALESALSLAPAQREREQIEAELRKINASR